MKTLRNILGTVVTACATLVFGSCSSTHTSASSNLIDDLYTTHDRAAIAERQRLIAEEEAAQARAQEALVKARLSQAGIRDAEIIIDEYDADNLVENSIQGAYERRLRGEASQTYAEGRTYADLLRDSGDEKTAYKLDDSDYNLMVMGDEVWLEPKYITSLFGRWDNRGRFSINFGINSLYDPYWDSPYYYWRDWGYWANNFYWDPYWGYRLYGYNPWWDWSFGWDYYPWGWGGYWNRYWYWDRYWGYYPHRPHGPIYGHGIASYPSDRYRGTTVYSRPRYASSGERSYRPGSSITSSGRNPAISSGAYRSNSSSNASYRGSGTTGNTGNLHIGPNGVYRGTQSSSSSSSGSSRPILQSRPSGSTGSSNRSTRNSSSSSSVGSSYRGSSSSSSSGAYRSNSSSSSSGAYRSNSSGSSYSGGSYSGGSSSSGSSRSSGSSSRSSR